jgi:hypothetical protein
MYTRAVYSIARRKWPYLLILVGILILHKVVWSRPPKHTIQIPDPITVRKIHPLVQPPSKPEGRDRRGQDWFYDTEERLHDVEKYEDSTDLPYEDEDEDEDEDDTDADDDFIYRFHDVEPEDFTDDLPNIPEFDNPDPEQK